MTALLTEIEAAQRSATVEDVLTRMRRGGYNSYESSALGWGMGHAQLNITDAVAEAERNGCIRTFIDRRTRKTMVALTEIGWQYPISVVPTMAELIYQVRRGNGQVRTVEQVAYSLGVERRDVSDLVRVARELGLITLKRDTHSDSGLLGLTALGRGFCITHGATTGESETLHGAECRCDAARLRRTLRYIVAEYKRHGR